MITQTINLNLIPGSPLPRINVSQYDNGSRTLQFNLYNGVSPYEIPSGASVYIVGTKADNTGFEYACTFDGSLVSVDITDQMTVFAGEVQSELRIVQSGEILGTANFIINVERAALSDDTQISETDIPIIQRIPEILEEAEGYADDAKHWAEQSESAVTGAVTYGYNGIMGAKNLLTFPYYTKSTTINGVTFTVNDDATITVNGTATADSVFTVTNYRNYDGNETDWNKIVESSSGKFRLTGCPSGGSTGTYYLQIAGGVEGHTTWWGGGIDKGNGVTFSATIDGNKFYIFVCRIVIENGCVCNNLVFKPMLRDAADIDETFRPYAKTNKELTDRLNNTHGNYYGTCTTAAATAAKVVTVDEDFKLAVGTTVTVNFTNTNTASNPTINVNGTGAKSIWYSASAVTTASLSTVGTANRYIKYMYDGTYWVWQGWSVDNFIGNPQGYGFGYGTCATAESTTAKVVTLANYVLTNGGYVSVKFTNGVPANATMNINSKGAKPIYYHGSAITAGIIKAGDVATFIYDGSRYVLTGVDSLSTRVGTLETKMGTSDISAIGDGTVTGGIRQLNSNLSLKQNYEYTRVLVSGGLNISITIPSSANEVIILCAHEGAPWSCTSTTLPNYEIQNAAGMNVISGGFQNGIYGLASTLYINRGVVQLTQYFEASQSVTSSLHLTAYYR